jgi:hypothetical protein
VGVPDVAALQEGEVMQIVMILIVCVVGVALTARMLLG